MARYKKLDKEALLDAAETVVYEKGAQALSIGTVAAAANVSRGGIQSTFGTKVQLVEALFQRWNADIEAHMLAIQTESPEHCDPMRVFLQASRNLHMSHPKRNAAMMFLMTETEARRQWAREWIYGKMDTIKSATGCERQRRLQFLLCEALLAIKSIELLQFSDEAWNEIFEDFDRLWAPRASQD